MGAEGGLVGFFRDEFAGQVDDEGAGAIGHLEIDVARSDSEGVADRAVAGLAVKRLLEVEGHRHMPGRERQQGVTVVIEVLAFVDQHGFEGGRAGFGSQLGE